MDHPTENLASIALLILPVVAIAALALLIYRSITLRPTNTGVAPPPVTAGRWWTFTVFGLLTIGGLGLLLSKWPDRYQSAVSITGLVCLIVGFIGSRIAAWVFRRKSDPTP